jgi:hypothetical protein
MWSGNDPVQECQRCRPSDGVVQVGPMHPSRPVVRLLANASTSLAARNTPSCVVDRLSLLGNLQFLQDRSSVTIVQALRSKSRQSLTQLSNTDPPQPCKYRNNSGRPTGRPAKPRPAGWVRALSTARSAIATSPGPGTGRIRNAQRRRTGLSATASQSFRVPPASPSARTQPASRRQHTPSPSRLPPWWRRGRPHRAAYAAVAAC